MKQLPGHLEGDRCLTGASGQCQKDAVFTLPNPEDAWRRFLEFDDRMATNILAECKQSGIVACYRDENTTIEDLAAEVARVSGINADTE